MPLYVIPTRVGNLDKSKCSPKFLAHGFDDDMIVNVKCTEDGTIDLRGNKGEYRIIVEDKQKKFTGYYDDNDNAIHVGDKLLSEWGYKVIVSEYDGDYAGDLICDATHTCKDIPYALNEGVGYTKIK